MELNSMARCWEEAGSVMTSHFHPEHFLRQGPSAFCAFTFYLVLKGKQCEYMYCLSYSVK